MTLSFIEATEALRSLKDADYILLDLPIIGVRIEGADIIVCHVSCAVQYYGGARYYRARVK